MDIRQFNIREATWPADKNHILGLRRLMSNASNLSSSDDQDDSAWHWIAMDTEDRTMGCIRITSVGNISRLLVLPEYQNQKTGKTLVECTLKKARHLELSEVHLDCPKSLISYFENLGFGSHNRVSSIPDFQTMIMTIDKTDSINQRKMLSSPELNTQVRDYDTAEVDWNQHKKAIAFLHHQILNVELGFDEKMRTEHPDKPAFQFVTRKDEQIIGTVELNLGGIISRLVVDADYRRKGIASSLLETVKIKAQRLGIKKLRCFPSAKLNSFLEYHSFQPTVSKDPGSVWEKEIVLRPIERIISKTDKHIEHTVVLGENNNFLLLRSKKEFQKLILNMCEQAKQSLHILSPFLDHALFDQFDLREICSILARKNKYTSIEILLFDPHRVIKNGHCLVELSRRLPSSMNIRIVHPEMRNSNHEYLIVDGRGYIYRQEVDLYEGFANFNDVTESNRLLRQFRKSWENSLSDPNLRQLKL